MRPKAELVNATINVLDRVHKQYLTMCQTEVTTKNIEFSFLINRLMVKYVFTALCHVYTAPKYVFTAHYHADPDIRVCMGLPNTAELCPNFQKPGSFYLCSYHRVIQQVCL